MSCCDEYHLSIVRVYSFLYCRLTGFTEEIYFCTLSILIDPVNQYLNEIGLLWEQALDSCVDKGDWH